MNHKLRKILLVLFAIAFVCSGMHLIVQEYQDAQAIAQYEEALRIAQFNTQPETRVDIPFVPISEPMTETEIEAEVTIPADTVPAISVPVSEPVSEPITEVITEPLSEPVTETVIETVTDSEIPVEPTITESSTAPEDPDETVIPDESEDHEQYSSSGGASIIDSIVDPLLDLDLAALQEVNPDVIGWIYIPDTPISYPLLQGEDNDYYLKKTWQEKYSRLGSIYLDYRNDDVMGDFNSIIYGHRIDSTTMFSSLRHYSKQSYLEEHPCIYIVTQNDVLCYNIYAAKETLAIGGHTYRLGLTESEDRQAYIDYTREDSVLECDIEIGPEDKILTLSTCTKAGSKSDIRWVVHAVLQ